MIFYVNCLFCLKTMKKSTVFSLKYLLFSFLLLMSWSSVAYADVDRDATPEERAKVTEALRKAGCSTVGDVDFYISTNQFNADPVICNDGKDYEVYLDQNFKIVSKREERD